MATCAAWPAPPGAKPNRGDARRFSVEESLDPSPDRCPGWLLEAAGNGRPRGMAIARAKPRAIQNPAYRPAGAIPRKRTPRRILHEQCPKCSTIRTCPNSFDIERILLDQMSPIDRGARAIQFNLPAA